MKPKTTAEKLAAAMAVTRGLRNGGLYDQMAASHPKLVRGLVYCKRCQRIARVDAAKCLRLGWPACCGETMSINLPEGQSQRAQPRQR